MLAGAEASSPPPTWPRSSAAWRRSRDEIERGALRLARRPRGRAPQHRGAPDRSSSATPASACTPAARATTRSRPTCASGCATRSTAIGAAAGRAAARAGRPRRRSTPRPSCPASPTCRWRSRCRSRTTCSPTSRCSRATPSAWPTCAARTNRLPLGAAALAGTSFPIDREAVAQGARLRRRLPELHRRGLRPRLRDRVLRRRRRCA